MYAPPRSNVGANAQHPPHPSQSSAAGELQAVLAVWETENSEPSFDVKATLIRLCELMEEATDEFMKQDPDPLDDRHPSKTYPSCILGHLLKVITRYDDFMNKLLVSYLMARDDVELNIAAARLLLNLIPGIDSSVLSEPEGLIAQLYRWAESDATDKSLRAYSFSLLSAALEVTSVASGLKTENSALIPIALRRLKDLFERMEREKESNSKMNQSKKESTEKVDQRPALSEVLKRCGNKELEEPSSVSADNSLRFDDMKTPLRIRGNASEYSTSEESVSPPKKKPRNEKDEQLTNNNNCTTNRNESLAASGDGTSNSHWISFQKRRLGEYRIFPLTLVMEQRMIIQYLTPVGEYQDLLKETYENRSLDLILLYLQNAATIDSRLIFDVLKYLASLLVHRKLALDFVSSGGIDLLIRIDRESVASVAVATCLYYLAYNTDAMEGVCLLPEQTLNELVRYGLWLLEHSYESGRSGASMFFTHTFSFRPFLERFDEYDGPRRLFNYISTLTLLQDDSENVVLSDEHLYTSVQAVRNTCTAFRSYMAAHVFVKAEHLKRTHASRLQSLRDVVIPSCIRSLPPNKGMFLDDDSLRNCVWLLLHAMNPFSTWRPVEELKRLGVLRTMLHLVSVCRTYSGSVKFEIVKLSLDILWMCSVVPRIQLDICEAVTKVRGQNFDCLWTILEYCEGELVGDTEIQFAALRVIINCVCAPLDRHSGRIAISPSISDTAFRDPRATRTYATPNKLRRQKKAQMEFILEKMWNCVRKNNGIMVLKKLLYTETPIAEADAIRATACQALNGLARSESVRQILEMMPLISNSELFCLMREPVLPERRSEHARFCEQAQQLVERVTKKRIHEFPTDLTTEKLWKWHIVAHTKVVYNEKELLQLIHQHLMKKGLVKTADNLRIEAGLPDVPASHLSNRLLSIGPLPKRYKNTFSDLDSDIKAGKTLVLNVSQASQFGKTQLSTAGKRKAIVDKTDDQDKLEQAESLESTTSLDSSHPSSSRERCTSGEGPSKILSSSSSNRRASTCFGNATNSHQSTSTNFQQSSSTMSVPHKDLEEIITDFFRKQHATCSNPVSTCPPFSLYHPHHCPEPQRKRFAPKNIVNRFFNRPLISTAWNQERFREDIRFAFSRFRPVRSFTENEETFTCCSFAIDDEHLLLGTYAGSLHWFNVHTGDVESNTECHHSAITCIEQSKDGSLLLTSSAFVKPLSSLWHIGETQEHMINFPDEYFVEFSKTAQTRIIGTQGSKATIYDTETGRAVVRLYDESLANNYIYNKATFDPRDEIVMNDGILWDPRMHAKVIHKFDKMNPTNCGLFHPRGNEIIINSEVWDVRNFRLLHSFASLNRCRIIFSGGTYAFYGIMHLEIEDMEDRFRHSYSSSFRTFDSTTYKVITTVDAKRPLYDLCADHKDQYMALIEAHGTADDFFELRENVCRLYEVGKQREADEGDDEPEEVPDDNEDDDDDDDDDDDADISSSEMDTSVAESVADFSTDDEVSDEEIEVLSSESAHSVVASSNDGDGHRTNREEHGNGNGEAAGRSMRMQVSHEALNIVFEPATNRRDIRLMRALDYNADSDIETDANYSADEDASIAHPGTSSIVLNPFLRKQRRAERDQQ